MTYVLHMDWNDFVMQAPEQTTIYLETYREPLHVQGMNVGFTSLLYGGYLVDEIVHAVLLVIEQVEVFSQKREIPGSAIEHADRAFTLARKNIQKRTIDVQRGMLLAPGLREDLKRIQTGHKLWAWQEDKGNGVRVLARHPGHL